MFRMSSASVVFYLLAVTLSGFGFKFNKADKVDDSEWISVKKIQDAKLDLLMQQADDTRATGTKKRSSDLPSCAVSNRVQDSVHHNTRHPREAGEFLTNFVNNEGKLKQAVYFTGPKQVLTLKEASRNKAKKKIPYKAFTTEIWVKPDGGQYQSVSIIELVDICSGENGDRGWSIGIQTLSKLEESDARFYFSLRTDRAKMTTTVRANRRYEPGQWTHIVALYTGTKMKLFVNGGMVGVGTDQFGDLFDPVAQRCKEVKLGGKPVSRGFFRGYVGRVHMWNTSLTHANILEHARGHVPSKDNPPIGLFFVDEFTSLDKWIPQISKKPPQIFPITSGPGHNLRLAAPPCGKTVCDDPDLVISYLQEPGLKSEKIVRYRIINIMDDDGLNPTVTEDQIFFQHRALIDAFKDYNVSWQLAVENVTNSFLRARLILFGCDSANIGDGTCDSECQTPMTGNDGGDCDTIDMPCSLQSIGNGICDYECDRAYHDWDGGDCCLPGPMVHQTCFDPTNSLRAYLSVEEYREMLGFTSEDCLNVYFATWTVKQLIGLATFPWENNLYTVQGGTIVQPENFGLSGSTDSLVHEFGHNLGLWHVHHGVSEMECNDKCLETHPSLTLGDLCSDTAPTPHNTHCRDPDASKTTCGVAHYRNTSFSNYMGYADDACTDHFTPQQVARMHCYLDLVYQPWRVSNVPAPVPMTPKVLSGSNSSVTIGWIPPLGVSSVGNQSVCGSCTADGALSQYAHSATSRRKHGDRSPEEAVGAPDADRCKGSTRLWLPDAYHCHNQCYLELYFQEPVIPTRLSIWATWNARDGIEDVAMYLEDGSIHSLGVLPAFCDIPVTRDLYINKHMYKIRIFTSTPFVGIDAVQVISKSGHMSCDACKPISYRISRSPPFAASQRIATMETFFQDDGVSPGIAYTYEVMAVFDDVHGPPSPVLTYTPGGTFCGDGDVNRESNEECDDGNTSDGDGCDVTCHVEEFFNCKGQPSLCYIHDGDGICEEFEKPRSVKDCGFYTPKGFIDQWASSVVVNPVTISPLCPEAVLTGAPPISQDCVKSPDLRSAWTPCGSYLTDEQYWIKVYFSRPVVATEVIVHFMSDGKTMLDPGVKFIQVSLISEDDDLDLIGKDTTLNCHVNPLHITIHQDLSQPFRKTKGVLISFSSHNIAISAVRLRSSHFLDPVTLQQCSSDEMYDVHRGRCISRTCSLSSCEMPKVGNGQFTCTGNSEGDFCKARCHKGYRLRRDDSEIRCLGGGWEEMTFVECVPVDCGRPAIPHASVVCPDGTSFHKECIFKCKRPARRQGEINSVVCEADGLWSMTKSRCRVQCQAPSTPANAVLASKSCNRGRHDVGRRCKFRCHKGHHVDGRARKRRVIKLTCEEDGKWVGLRCVPDTCSPPDPIFTGLYQCSKEFRIGSQCYLSCPDDRYNQQKITCNENGKWDGDFTMCRFSATAHCPSLQKYENGLILNCHGHDPGSTCEARCRYPHQHPVTNQKPEDISPRDTVIILTCTGTRRWYPDVAGISCVESCSADFVGDGWCDAKNNRAQCLWDGGDCCLSTTEGRPVQPFPDTCTTECTCKDPDALENNGYSETSNRSKSVSEAKKHADKRLKSSMED